MIPLHLQQLPLEERASEEGRRCAFCGTPRPNEEKERKERRGKIIRDPDTSKESEAKLS